MAESEGVVTGPDEVAGKTTPNLREATPTDNAEYYEDDFLAGIRDGDDVPAHMHEANAVTVRTGALLKSLLPVGDVEIVKFERVAPNEVHIVYRVRVEHNLGENAFGVAVREQPDDTVGELRGAVQPKAVSKPKAKKQEG